MAEKSLYQFPPGLVCIIAIICSCCSDKPASAPFQYENSDKPASAPFQYENLGFLHPLEREAIAANKISAIFIETPLEPITGEQNDIVFIWQFDTMGNFIFGGDWYTERYQYDSLNRVIIEESGSCITQPDSFQYQQISEQQLLRLGVLGDSAWIDFNKQGLPIRSFVKFGRYRQTITTTFIYDEHGYLIRRVIENAPDLSRFDAYMVHNIYGVCSRDSIAHFQQEFFIKNGKLEKSVSDFRCSIEGDTFKMSTVCQFDSTGLRDYFLLNGKKMHFQHTRQPSDN